MDIVEDFDVVDHKVIDDKPWFKIRKFRGNRKLRNLDTWISFDDFVIKTPARAIFYPFQRSLFMIDPAWEVATLHFDDWIKLDTSCVNPNKNPRIYIDEV